MEVNQITKQTHSSSQPEQNETTCTHPRRSRLSRQTPSANSITATRSSASIRPAPPWIRPPRPCARPNRASVSAARGSSIRPSCPRPSPPAPPWNRPRPRPARRRRRQTLREPGGLGRRLALCRGRRAARDPCGSGSRPAAFLQSDGQRRLQRVERFTPPPPADAAPPTIPSISAKSTPPNRQNRERQQRRPQLHPGRHCDTPPV